MSGHAAVSLSHRRLNACQTLPLTCRLVCFLRERTSMTSSGRGRRLAAVSGRCLWRLLLLAVAACSTSESVSSELPATADTKKEGTSAASAGNAGRAEKAGAAGTAGATGAKMSAAQAGRSATKAPAKSPAKSAATEDDAGSDPPSADAGKSQGMQSPDSGNKKLVATKPRVSTMLVGPTASYAAPDTEVYGSDMATSFEYNGKVVVLFGDTFSSIENACDNMPRTNNDMVGTLPGELGAEPPKLDVVRGPSSKTFQGLKAFQGGASVNLSDFKIPIAGFSDGQVANVIFQAQLPVTCDPAAPVEQQGCPAQDGVQCIAELSSCEPATVSVPNLCEPASAVCLAGGCKKYDGCIDSHSSQYDGSKRGIAASIMSNVLFTKARGDDLATYDVVATWQTNKFAQPTVRPVKHFSGKTSDADYSFGSSDLLIWGRMAMHAEEGRQARLYFATVPLPLPASDSVLHPRYFAGSHEMTGQPIWTEDQAEAAALPMDGHINGDASEPQGIVTSTTLSWLGEPINRWVMMYGGDLPNVLLADPNGTRMTPHTGAIVMRFAEHPWGPWSPAVEHLPAGSPNVMGDAYGPGGIMFHPDCKDLPNAKCAPSDPVNFALCNARPPNDLGRLYSPAIIDAYTRKNDQGGLDITWAVSTWVPYGAYLMQTSINPE